MSRVTAQIRLPGRAGPLVIPEPGWAASYPPPAARRVFAAAHVAARPAAGGEVIDWESTMRFRDHLWAHGFGVAEAMDTAQRGAGLFWAQARELIARSAARAAEHHETGPTTTGKTRTGLSISGLSITGQTTVGPASALAVRAAERHETGQTTAGPAAALACGVGTDQLADGDHYRISDIIGAYAEQIAFVQSTGAQVILMASRALAASARGARDYLEVYGELLKQADRPVILHWLGEAFDPALRGYWGSTDFDPAADTVIELIERAGGQVDGIKLSVLDARREMALRRRLPAGVRLYTGDDFNYAGLIRGDATGPGGARPGDRRNSLARNSLAWPSGAWHSHARHSDALLGAFAAITAPAAAALRALDEGDVAGYDAAMAPTVPLSRMIFEPPTYYYKVGVAFLAWLNGLQPHFAMLAGLQRRRPARHLIQVFELAAAARALTNPDLAAERMTGLLATFGGPERV